MLTLKEAVEQTGKSRPGLLKAIKTGRLSAKKQNGQWVIDPAELFRVYDRVSDTGLQKLQVVTDTENVRLKAENQALQKQLDREKELNRDLHQDRDHWRGQATSAQRLLEDMRPKSPQKASNEPLTLWQWLGLAKR